VRHVNADCYSNKLGALLSPFTRSPWGSALEGHHRKWVGGGACRTPASRARRHWAIRAASERTVVCRYAASCGSR